jgi:hypothetical protein
MSALIIQGLISGTIGGLTAIIKNSAAREEARQQAFNLREQVKSLDAYSAEAISNLESIFGRASGAVRESMTTQAQLAVDDITQQFTDSIDTMTKSLEKARGNFGDQAEARRETYIEALKNYSASMKDQRQNIKNAFTAQRMGVSGAFVDAMTKSAKVQGTAVKGMNADQMKFEQQISEQLANVEQNYAEQISKTTDAMGRQVSNVRLNAGAQIGQALSGLEMQLGQQQQAYRDSAFNQRTKLNGAAANLDNAAKNGNGFTDFLGGAASGLAGAASGLFQDIFNPSTGNTNDGGPAFNPTEAPFTPATEQNAINAEFQPMNGPLQTPGGMDSSIYDPSKQVEGVFGWAQNAATENDPTRPKGPGGINERYVERKPINVKRKLAETDSIINKNMGWN